MIVFSLSSVAGADYGPIDMVLEVSSVDTLLITVSIYKYIVVAV